MQLVDEVIPEPVGGAHTDLDATATNLKTHLIKHLEALQALSAPERLKQRYDKFRAHGRFLENASAPAEAGEVPANGAKP